MLCFSIVDKLSFDNIQTKWYPAIKKASQKPEIRLIGTKSDLKKSISPAQCIHKDEAVNLAKEINAFDYVECSSFLNDGVMQVFDLAFRKAVQNINKKDKMNLMLYMFKKVIDLNNDFCFIMFLKNQIFSMKEKEEFKISL